MNQFLNNKYGKLSDKDIIDKIIAVPPNDEAAAYLLYYRYTPKFMKICRYIYGSLVVMDDCVDDLYVYLRGNEFDWAKLRTFEGRSQFSTWLGRTAYRRFLQIKPRLIGKIENTVSIDNAEGLLANFEKESYERKMQKVMLMEAIGQLKDAGQKFVILKTLEGYESSEIAELMKKKWQSEGIVKHNNKGEIVVPSAQYVDVLRQRAKKELKQIITD